MSPKKSRPTHPGEMLREDFLPDYGLTASGLAKALGVSPRTVNKLLRERSGVSLMMALRLSRFFGNSPEFWLNAQRAVDLWDVLKNNRNLINRIVPLKHIRDGMIIDRNAKKLNKEARDVMNYVE